jgi:hypothetical protein
MMMMMMMMMMIAIAQIHGVRGIGIMGLEFPNSLNNAFWIVGKQSINSSYTQMGVVIGPIFHKLVCLLHTIARIKLENVHRGGGGEGSFPD